MGISSDNLPVHVCNKIMMGTSMRNHPSLEVYSWDNHREREDCELSNVDAWEILIGAW